MRSLCINRFIPVAMPVSIGAFVSNKARPANSLIATPRRSIGVGFRKLMSPIAVSLSSILGTPTISSKNILRIGDRFHVFGVHTEGSSAQVVNNHFLRDKSLVHEVRPPMSSNGAAIKSYPSVPSGGNVSRPYPTSVFSFIDSLIEAIPVVATRVRQSFVTCKWITGHPFIVTRRVIH